MAWEKVAKEMIKKRLIQKEINLEIQKQQEMGPLIGGHASQQGSLREFLIKARALYYSRGLCIESSLVSLTYIPCQGLTQLSKLDPHVGSS